MADAARTHFRTCHLCEAMCGIAIDLEGDRIVRVRGDKDDPFSRGHVCPKAVALQDVHEDTDRLRRPLRRTASGWEEVPWETALDEAAARLAAVQRAHGRNAVALYQGNPVVHNHGAILFGQVFQRSLGSRSRYSATSVDQLPQMLASLLMFGHQLMLPIPDVDRTGFLLVLGANPLVSNGSILTAPGIERRLKALKARGGRLVVVDPRRTETAALADLHLPIRPGGDAFLLAALVHTLATENRTRSPCATRRSSPSRSSPRRESLDTTGRSFSSSPRGSRRRAARAACARGSGTVPSRLSARTASSGCSCVSDRTARASSRSGAV